MFKKFTFLAGLLFATAAWGQNPQCPTRPVGDNTNACASTAFVMGEIATVPTLAGNNTWTGDNFFTSGRPWCDVIGQGASPTGTNDAGVFINQCIAKVQALGGGLVYIGPGFFAGPTGISVTGSAPVIIMGAGESATTFQVTADVDAILLNSPQSRILNMSVVGLDHEGATHYNLHMGSSCVQCRADHLIVASGIGMLTETEVSLFDLSIRQQYGTAQLTTRSTTHEIRVAHDLGWPGTTPPFGTAINAWSSGVNYAQNTPVIANGWYWQKVNAGTQLSSGTAPSPAGLRFGQTYNNGSDTIQWMMVSKVGTCGLALDSGSFASDSVNGDYSGAYDYGVCNISNNIGSIYFGTGSTFSAITEPIHVTGGGNFVFAGINIGGANLPTSVGAHFSGAFTGPLQMSSGQIINNKTGILVESGTNISISGFTALPGSQTNVMGIHIGSGVSGFSIINNPLDTDAIFGTLAVGIQVDAGAGDNLAIFGNTCKSVATCINNSATGAHQTSEQNGTWTFGAPSTGNRIILDPTAATGVNLTGSFTSAVAHSFNGTSNVSMTQLADNSGQLRTSGAFPLHLGANNTNYWDITSAGVLVSDLATGTIAGGANTNSVLALKSTTSGSPSGDSVTITAGGVTNTYNAIGTGIGLSPTFRLDLTTSANNDGLRTINTSSGRGIWRMDTTRASARNYAMGTSVAALGDFGLMQSASAGTDPVLGPIIFNVTTDGAWHFNTVTDATSTSTGSVQILGGLGVTKSIFATNYGLISFALSATAPIISAGFCTSPSVPANNGTAAFTINVGTACAASTGTLSMPAAANGWVCDFHDVTTPAGNVVEQTGGATNTVTLTNYARTTGVAANFTSSDVIRAKCVAY